MATDIEWAEETWNPITGCTKISEGCKNCYAERMAKRLAGRYGYPKDKPFRITYHPNRLTQPAKWRKPKMIFVCSMGDLFHRDVDVDSVIYDNLIWAMRIYDHHTFLLLTKRPEKMQWVVERLWHNNLPPNVWLGITAENQQRADERIPILLNIPAAVHFVSVEPMLEAIDLNGTSLGQILGPCDECGKTEQNHHCEACMGIPSLSWVICGGESGPGARPMHPDWVRSLRDQCIEAAVPFMFKQWGEYMGLYSYPPSSNLLKDNGGFLDWGKEIKPWGECNGQPWVWKTGKKKSGRLLDGKVWDQYPTRSGQVENKP